MNLRSWTRHLVLAALLAVLPAACGDPSNAIDNGGAVTSCDDTQKDTLCCCAGDVHAALMCSEGEWACPQGYQLHSGAVCDPGTCGGPCNLPCASDMAGP